MTDEGFAQDGGEGGETHRWVLQLDFDPASAGPTPWPLHFRRGGRIESASLAIGDLIVFRGTDVEHYRDELTCGRSSTSLAFCFVAENFEGSLD